MVTKYDRDGLHIMENYESSIIVYLVWFSIFRDVGMYFLTIIFFASHVGMRFSTKLFNTRTLSMANMLGHLSIRRSVLLVGMSKRLLSRSLNLPWRRPRLRDKLLRNYVVRLMKRRIWKSPNSMRLYMPKYVLRLLLKIKKDEHDSVFWGSGQ
jgi:hypothetical protein